MKKKSNGFGYFFSEGLRSIFLHGFMSFAAICIIIACLILMGSFSLLAVNVNEMLTDFEKDSEILAYVDESLTDAEARSIGSRLNMLDNVAEVEFISREEATQSFVSRYEGSELFEELDSSTFRHRYRIVLEDISRTAETKSAVEQVEGIAKVNAYLELSEGFVSVRNIATIVSVALIVVLLVISVFIIANTIKLATFDRREEIAIMKMVGATNGFIRWPFIFQGFILGLIAAVVAFFAQWGLYSLVTQRIVSSDTMSIVTVIPFDRLMPYVGAVFAVTGLLVGVFGSAITIRKYLKV